MGSLAMGHAAPRAPRDYDPDAPSPAAGLVAVAGKPQNGDLRELLERDGVLIVDTEPFRLTSDELALIERHWSDGRSTPHEI
jgi:hypothetical protein